MNYVFHMSPADPKPLLDQAAHALEKRTELISRARYPSLWKITDKLRGDRKPMRRNLRRTRMLGLLNLFLGLFLLIPSIAKPKELLIPLLMGAVGVCVGISGLLRSRKGKPDKFDHTAAKLLQDRDKLRPGSCTVTLDNAGITILQDGKSIAAPWADFRCIVETQDLLLICYDSRATFLLKSDLQGSMNALRNTLRKKVSYGEV